MKDQLEQETKELRAKLEEKEREASNNQSATTILNSFIAQGQMELDAFGNVRLTQQNTPNVIRNDLSMIDDWIE